MADLDVLVVGAGPTGLMAACELRRHGQSVRIVDSAASPTTLSKAIATSAYAGSTECLYLLRSDLYVAYRSQPADEGKLVAYLKTILR